MQGFDPNRHSHPMPQRGFKLGDLIRSPARQNFHSPVLEIAYPAFQTTKRGRPRVNLGPAAHSLHPTGKQKSCGHMVHIDPFDAVRAPP